MVFRRNRVRDLEKASYHWDEKTGSSPNFLFDFGMAFMADKPITLKNRDEVERTPHKSFQNVLLELDKQYRPG